MYLLVFFNVTALQYDRRLKMQDNRAIFRDSVPELRPASARTTRIFLFTVWRGTSTPYLGNFFASVRANEEVLDLLWIGVTDEDRSPCLDVSKWTGPSGAFNIRTVCLSNMECAFSSYHEPFEAHELKAPYTTQIGNYTETISATSGHAQAHKATKSFAS